MTIWCPFDTEDSLFVKLFRQRGYTVIATHIANGQDFFAIDPPKCDYIISNPPYSLKGEVFERLFQLNIPFAMLVAIPLSLLIYGVKPIKETIMPVVSFLRYVPVTAFSPLLILWFGIGEQMKISFLFIATFVYLLPSILLCFNDVPQDLMDTGKTIGMTSWETIKEILLPASLPSIFSTFLMMYGIGWTYCAVVEATNAKYGLGFIINVSSARGRTAVVFGAIIVIMLFSFVFDKLGNLLIRKIFQWRYCDDQVE